ncbi:MAG: hypothetical protein IJH64_00655 [Oscillospiraceae bacterium]|nr:hypothetical protein [Oscillospiraceae bacterium]
MKHLYIAQTNAMNYIVLRDMSRGEDDTAVVDWDVSDDEIKSAVPDDYEPDEWKSFDEIMETMNSFQTIESYIKDMEEG